jgi:hypothetical protein
MEEKLFTYTVFDSTGMLATKMQRGAVGITLVSISHHGMIRLSMKMLPLRPAGSMYIIVCKLMH